MDESVTDELDAIAVDDGEVEGLIWSYRFAIALLCGGWLFCAFLAWELCHRLAFLPVGIIGIVVLAIAVQWHHEIRSWAPSSGRAGDAAATPRPRRLLREVEG